MDTTILPRCDHFRRVALTWLSCVCAVPGVAAQQWRLEAGVGSELMWTSNSDFGESSGKEDTVLELRPYLSMHRDGGRLSVSGAASLSALSYARHTQPGRVQPTADLTAKLAVLERLLFVDAGYRAVQTSENPYLARPDAASGSNTLTTSTFRFSPYVDGEAGSDVRYQLRSDHSWTRGYGGADDGAPSGSASFGYFARHSASIERRPQPLGWRLEAERSRTRYDDSTLPSPSLDVARFSVNYALFADFSAGVRGGYERDNLDATDDRSRSFSGVQARWQPSERTNLTAFREQRFFGSAWQLAFEHRNPQIAWTMNFMRGIDTTPQSLFELPATNNVAMLLDAAFTTRFPDPAERARVVQEYMARQGLPSSTLRPMELFAGRLSVVTTRSASLVLIGVRSSLALSAFQARTEDALDTGPLAIGTALSNNRQWGGAIVLSHRLTPSAGMNVVADWSRVRALGDAPDQSTQQGLRVQFNMQASATTTAYVGGRFRKLQSNVANAGREGAVLAGLDHRF